MMMDLIRKYAAPVPRYTSYPTALSFSPSVGADLYTTWLQGLSTDTPLSLYVHIPYCKSICWYCGCHAKAARRPEPIKRYLDALEAETTSVSNVVSNDCTVRNVHWGGGSPNSLDADDITRLANTLKRNFHIGDDVEFAVEIDPRSLNEDQADAFARAGVNRVSLGVQDFDDNVQAAIGRIQSFETTKAVAELLRANGITSLNVDLVYGLPRQTRESAERTMDCVLALQPARVALFGYAHFPTKFKRQRLVDETALPGSEKRFALANRMASRLTTAGYVRIGLDHFARPEDPLARGPIYRNFQGYTSDKATTVLGLGASAISKLPDGYSQNAVSVGDYERTVIGGCLATTRGYVLTDEDRMRGFAIERLMCDLAFPADELRERFGAAADPLIMDAHDILDADADGLVEKVANGFRVTERGRPFLRAISACFDAHRDSQTESFSTGV